jgi:RNA polymerase-binding transcription factor DksA
LRQSPKASRRPSDLLAMIQAERRAVEEWLGVPGPSIPAGGIAEVGGDNTPTSETVAVAQGAMVTDLNLAFREWLLARLNALQHAEDKIRQGTYGLCQICAEPIPLGLAFVAVPLSQALAAAAQPVSLSQEKPGQSAAGLTAMVGTVMAVVPNSRTIVVDVPLEKGMLRLGAIVPETARITADGKPVTLNSLAKGSQVRIEFRETPTGDEATAIEVLQTAGG